MSTLTTFATEAGAQLASVQAAGPGFLDWATNLNASTLSLVRGIAITLGVLFVIIRAVSSRGAMAQIIVAGIAAAIFVWIIFNVTQLRDTVGNDLPGAVGVVTIPPEQLPAIITPIR